MAIITPEMARAELARRELAKRQFNPQQQSSEGIGSIPGDIASGAGNILMKAGEKAIQIPGEISDSAKQLYENPLREIPRAERGFLSGLTEGAKQIYNAPLNLNTYLASKNVPVFKQTAALAEKLKIGDTGLQKAVMGEPKPGDELWQDLGEVAGIFAAPESILGKVPSVTAKGLAKQISKEKSKQIGIAKKEYGNLFQEANEKGLKYAFPAPSVLKHQEEIVKNSIPKYHKSFKEYIEMPTIENAHWAQSELGALERHLDSISQKTGLTPSQIKTYKAVKDARSSIKKSMFSENVFGSSPALAMKYDTLATKYKENVIPYTKLQDLSEFEAGRMRPKTTVKNLLNDEEFMLKLAKKYPGIRLHTPFAKKVGLGVLGLTGYDEIKKLLNRS